MMAGQARYLLRFDDLCPTMALDRWKRFLPLIEEFGIRPILAVVPENCDPELKVAADDPEFWSAGCGPWAARRGRWRRREQ